MLDDATLRAWFCHEVLPLEPALMRFIHRHWRIRADAVDLRQDIYERILIGAARELPRQVAPYVFTTARNHLINKAKQPQVISLYQVSDLEAEAADADHFTPERVSSAREEIQRVQAGLDNLPARCREVIWLRKVEGLSTREVATRMGVGIDTVEQQTTRGLRALVDFMLGGSGRVQRRSGPAGRTDEADEGRS